MSECIFGPSPIPGGVLATTVVREIRKAGLPNSDGRGNSHKWTAFTKELLRKLAEDRALNVRCHGYGGELMLDMVWGDDIDLAIEIEWQVNTAKDVIDDFQKLVRVKAPLKLMVYWVNSPQQHDTFRCAMEGHMQKYTRHVAGEKYVFVAMGFTEKGCPDRFP